MNQHAKILFGIAAAFNLAVAASLTLGWSLSAELLQLSPAEGSNRLLVNVAAVLVLSFGIAYALVAHDPRTYRPYVLLGVIGKLLVVAVAVPVLVSGGPGQLLAGLALGDLLFAVLFLDFLRRHPAGVAALRGGASTA